MKLHVLDLGRLTFDANGLTAGGRYATVADPAAPNALVTVPVSAYCIEHPAGNVLYDTGCHPDAMGPDGRWPAHMQVEAPHSGQDCDLPYRLSQLGLTPDDMHTVVLSHLHNDHAGCVEFFRKSRLIVHADEFSAALRTYGLRHDTTPYVRADIARWCDTELNWHLMNPAIERLRIAEGIEVLNFGPGHSYGMLGLHVRLPETGSVILVSDAVYCNAIYGPERRMPGEVIDSLGVRTTVDRIHALQAEYNAQVWFGHDPEQFATLRLAPEAAYL